MRVLYLSAIIVVCDQITKLLVKGISIPWLGITWPGMPYGSSIPLLGDFLRLTYIENPGMAFGIEVGGKVFFSLFSLAAGLGIGYYLYRVRQERLGFRISLAMILGGAVGNLIDRVLYGVLFEGGSLFEGRVIDFIDVDFFDIDLWGYHLSRWPVFNIADASVTLGVLFLLLFHRTSLARDPDRALHPSSVQAGPAPRDPSASARSQMPRSPDVQ